MRRRKSGSLINLSTWNRDHVLNTERWNGDKQVVANVWTGQSPSASSLTCDFQASDQNRQKSISQTNTVGVSRESLSLVFLWLHMQILRVNRGNVLKSTPWEMALINSLSVRQGWLKSTRNSYLNTGSFLRNHIWMCGVLKKSISAYLKQRLL